jgi:hypothetical protein
MWKIFPLAKMLFVVAMSMRIVELKSLHSCELKGVSANHVLSPLNVRLAVKSRSENRPNGAKNTGFNLPMQFLGRYFLLFSQYSLSLYIIYPALRKTCILELTETLEEFSYVALK